MRRVTSLLLLMLFFSVTAFSQNASKGLAGDYQSGDPMTDLQKMQQMEQQMQNSDAARDRTQMPGDALGDIVYSLDLETICGDNQLLGVEYVDGHFWVTGAGNSTNPNYIYEVDPVAGTLVNSYEQGTVSTWGMRDLAWVEADGLLYAGDGDGFYSIDPADGTVTTVFAPTGMGVIRALAYDGTNFWTKSFGDALYEFAPDGTILNTYNPTVATATYGAAYDFTEEYLYLFSQDDAVFYQFGLDGTHTGVTYDVSAAQAGGISGGAFYDFGNLVPGFAVLGFALQGTPDIVAAMELYPSEVYPNDVGVSTINQPTSGIDLTNAEPVEITIKNYGTNSQSDIPWEVTSTGPVRETFTGVFAGPLAAGETALVEVGTVDLSAYGSYSFEACTQLVGDEFMDNDCKTKTVTNEAPSLCVDNLYSSGCSFGDGLISWNLANIDVPNIPCEGTPPWYHDYTDQIHELAPGMTYTLTIVAGYGSTNVDVWIDFNDDLDLTDDELILDDAECANGNEVYTFDITIPAGATAGEHVLRFRTNWISVVEDACETYSYGNACDFTANLGEPAAADVGVTSIDVPAFVEPGVVEMYATVQNFGTDTQTFDVTLTDEVLDYSSTMTVTDLAGGESLQVMFDSWTAAEGVYNFTACTELTGDENPDNDCMEKTITAQFPFSVYAYNAYDPTGTLVEGPITFDLGNPGVITQLAPTTSDQFLAGGCWAPGGMWYGVQYFDGTIGGGLWEVDPANGDMTFIGGTGDFTGLAHDGSTLYASSVTDLYTVDPVTGTETLVGPMGNPGAVMIGIGCNSAGDLYGFDIVDDTFYMIDKGTGAATAIGPMGFDFNYAQDMSFDKNTDVCYLSGYTATGGLYTVDVATGAATFIAEFQGGSEITAFAIPYDYPTFDNDLGIMAIVSPETGYNLTDMEDVTVTIKNFGEVAQSGFDVTYSFATDNPVTETVAETIEPGATLDYTFTVPADLSAYGDYNFTACTELAGDENPDNDCKEKLVQNLEFGEISGSTKNANTNQALVDVLVEANGYSTVSTGGPFGAFYTLGDLPAGTYTVVASKEGFFNATYPDIEVLPGEATTLNISLVPDVPLALPFMEMWDDTSFTTNIWSFNPEQGNWNLDAANGNPAPSAEFHWSPSAENYEYSMESRKLEGYTVEETEVVLFDYDLYLSNYSMSTVEAMAVDVWDGTEWVEVAYYDNQNDDIPWTTFSHNITDLVTGIEWFKVRFRAYGEDSFNINDWRVDNIHVYQTTFVNFSGTITEQSSGAPIEGATIMLENSRYEVQTGPDGTFSIDIQAGTYDVTLTADGYNTVTAEGVEILEDFVWDVAMTAPTLEVAPGSFSEELELSVIQDYTITVSNNGNGPVDWNANVLFGAKDQSVVSPGIPADIEYVHNIDRESIGMANTAKPTPSPNMTDDEVIRYDDGVNNDAIGLTDGGTFQVAAYWPAATMGQYAGMKLSQVEVYINDLPVPFVLKIYGAGTPTDPGELLHEQTATVDPLSWNVIVLSEPVDITGDDIWIGYEVTHAAGEFPAGCDAGPAVAGFGDMISLDGVTFEPMSGLGLDYNWNIAATLVPGVTPWLTLAPTSGSLTGSKASEEITMTLNTTDLELGQYYYADIVFSSDPDVGDVVVPVELFITGDLGFFTGVVTDPMSRAPVQGVTITAENVDNMFSTTTGADGTYNLPVLAGTYDLMAEKDNYMMQMVEDLTVALDETVVQDFMLEFEPPVLLTAEGSYLDVSLEWEGNSLLSGGGKDGGKALATNVKEMGYKAPPTGVYDKSKYPDMTRQGGDLIEDATVIPELPYNNTGTTAGYTNDYDEVCPFSGSTAPDVVYSFTPAEDVLINIDLCGSAYDTKLYVYENELTAGNPYACNDDEYGSGDPCGSYVSALFDLFVTGGNTYYIVVDGYGTGSGDYIIDVTGEVYNPCVLECPPEAIAEGEECPGDEYVDTFNGGCNADVPAFTPVSCGDIVCGTASTYMFEGSNYRDTDWYELVITEPQVVSFSVTAEFPVIGGLIEQVEPGVPGCDNITGFISPFGSVAECEELALEMTLIPGTYYFFVAPGVFEGYPCGTSNDYIVSWECSETFVSYFNVYRDGVDIADVYGTTYVDTDVEEGNTYCYTVDQVYEPGMMTGESNELCADVLLAPVISVTPDMLMEELEPGMTSSQVLTLENLGLGEMVWEAEVVTAKARTSGQLGAYPEATMTQEQSDDANPEDVYKVPGQNVPLAGTRDVLYDNGPLETGECATTGDPESMIQDPQTAFGVNFNNAAGWSIADDFVVEGGEWTIETFEFFGYQTDGGVPSTLDGAFVSIWDGNPMDGGAVIWGDQVTDIFVSTEWTGMYRVSTTGTCNTQRAIHKVVADAGGLTLSPGTYWIEWSVTGTTTSGPWCPLVSDVNQTPDGNGLSNNSSGTWSAYTSGGVGVEWPFIINGAAGTPWLTIDQTGGTLESGGSLDINVGFDATELGPGTYTGTISFMSNDPITPMVDVPVELVVYVDEGTLAGYVTDATSRGPVEGVTITADGIRESTTTNEEGYYELVLPVGDYMVTAEKPGYITQTVEPVTIELGATTQLDFMLEFAGPVLLYADGGIGQINLGWEANPSARGEAVHPSYAAEMGDLERMHGPTVKLPYSSGRATGDDCTDPIVIGALPYTTLDSTCGRGNYTDTTCLGSYDGGEDIFYMLTLAEETAVSITMETTTTWTGMLLTDECPPSAECIATATNTSSGGVQIQEVLPAGTYYIMIDTWPSPNCIPEFTLTVEEYEVCVVDCPAGALEEPELCGEDLNGGCNAVEYAATPIACGDVFCGTAWADGGNRDTDWYELVITEPKTVTWSVTAEFPVLAFIIDGNFGCEGLEIIGSATAAPCEEAVVTADLIPGTYWLWVGDQAFEGNPCGDFNNYVAEVTCADTFITYYNVFRDGDQIAETYYDTYMDTDIMPDTEYCYTVTQIIEPGLETPESNELCATMLCEMGCDYTLNFTDSWGDGWNGAAVTIIQNGTTIGDFTLASGDAGTAVVELCGDLETSLVWVEGSYDGECGFELVDPLGNVLYSFVAGEAPAAGEFFNFITECPEMLEQQIVMEEDWNAWSSYINPDVRMGMEEMMDPIINEMIITQYFSQLYYPEYGIMNMDDFTNQHGYFSKMSAAATLPISGYMADPTVNIPAGWSLFPVLQDCSIAAADVFSNIPGFVIAWDPVGNGIYYPEEEMYTLVDLNPGMAYWIKVDADASYTYPGCTKASGANNTSLRPVNNTNWNDVNFTPVNHAVIFDASAVTGLQEGDMVGAFTSNNWCAGMAEFNGGNLGFNLFGDDLTTDMADGFVEGESLTFRLFRPATEEEFEMTVTYDYEAPNADGLFAINGISVISDLKLSPTSIGENLLHGLNIYPNPSSGVFNIAIGNLDEEIDFVVLNAQGQEVYNGSLIESQQLDLSAEPKGVYFIKFINESVLGIEKLVIK